MSARHPRCSYEDAIAAAFLDGAPAAAPFELEEHLAACPACRRHLELCRRIDALVAARTPTELDEATADRLLAVVRAAEPVPAGGAHGAGRLTAAALCAAALAAALFAPPPDRAPPRGHSPRRSAVLRLRALPAGPAGPRPRELRFTRVLAGRAFAARARLAQAAGRLLERYTAGRLDGEREVLAAASWLLRAGGGLRCDPLALLAKALDRAPRAARRRLAAHLAAELAAGRASGAVRQRLRELRDPAAAAVAGAAGFAGALPRLLRRPRAPAERALRAARGLLSPQALALRVDWFLAARRRGLVHPSLFAAAFEHLPPAEAAALARVLRQRLSEIRARDLHAAAAALARRLSAPPPS